MAAFVASAVRQVMNGPRQAAPPWDLITEDHMMNLTGLPGRIS
jgi:hypothetical protein